MAQRISSELLGSSPVQLGNETGKLDIYDGLSTPISNDVIILSHQHAKNIADFARASAAEYGDAKGNKEQTLVQRELGVPSLVVRVDATINDGSIVAYEMEDSPSGLGITDKIHHAIAGVGIREIVLRHYEDAIGEIPRVIVSAARSHGTDDAVVFGENYIFDKQGTIHDNDNNPVIVKSIPGHPESHAPYIGLQSRAVAPLATEGDKSYLERTGVLSQAPLEKDLLQDDKGELASQVVKARQGSMAMGIALYLTSQDRRRFTNKGTVSASKLRHLRGDYEENRGGALVQPFVPPIQIENKEGRKNAILRVFVLLGREASVRVIGGCYVARPGLIVHGSSDAVSGAVLYNGEQS